MSRSKSRKKSARKKRIKKDEGLQLASHPLNSANRELLLKAFKEHGRLATESIPTHLEKILKFLKTHEPLTLAATISQYGSMQGVGKKGPTGKRLYSLIDQHHIEILQALILYLPSNEWGEAPAAGSITQAVIEEVVELSDAFSASRMAKMDEALASEQKLLLSIQERLRLHTQIVRNWGYLNQVLTLSKELYSVVDKNLKDEVGFTSTSLIHCIKAMVEIYENRSSERFATLSRVLNKKNKRDLVNSYFKENPDFKGTPEHFLSNIPEMDLRSLKSMILSHADLFLVRLSTFSVEEIALRTGILESEVALILRQISLEPGELSGLDPMHFFMDNPVWKKPGIFLNDNYVFPAPQIGLSHIHRILRSIINKSKKLKETYEHERSNFLEDKIEEIITRCVGSAYVRTSVKWNEFETDCLVIIDRTVLIVEGKSAALTDEALRGAPDRAKRHIDDLITEPAIQSNRLQETIEKARDSKDVECLKTTQQLGINANEVDNIIRISVTLDDFSILSAAESDLKKMGWVPKDLELPATVNIADFQTIFDILEKPQVIFHYFQRRLQLQKKHALLADELDLLGIYLKSLFHIPELGQGVSLSASGESKAVDDYYAKIEAGFSAKKPLPAIPSRVGEILQLLDSRRPSGWTTMSLDLIQIGNAYKVRKIWHELDELKKNVVKNYQIPEHKCALVILPDDYSAAIIFYIFTEKNQEMRNKNIEQLINETFESTKRGRITLIAKKVENWNVPYSIAAFALAAPDAIN